MASGRVFAATILMGVIACGSSRDRATETTKTDAGLEAGPFGGGGGDAAAERTGTCDEAKKTRSYVGCEYWPTITPNPVWSVFDFAVVIANLGSQPAEVTLTGPGSTDEKRTVAPGSTDVVVLPWVKPLKGPDASECGMPLGYPTSVVGLNASYHLTSDRPIVAYQFSPLEYRPEGGKPGKDWTCPNNPICAPCFSYSNDASLLLPTAALGAVYRINAVRSGGTSVSVTATEAGTRVDFRTSKTGRISAGGGILAAGPGEVSTVTLNAGDVAQFFADAGSDVSGSLVVATAPVQVVVSNACINLPDSETSACDHIEETVMPAETLGKRHVVARPPRPAGGPVGHVVRITGNVDGTTLTYEPSRPTDCPLRLDAGDSVQCLVENDDFMVTGSSEISVATFLLGSEKVDPQEQRGDPSQSLVPPVEQYRKDYVFLAPRDYDLTFAKITSTIPPPELTLDGAPVALAPTPIGASGFGVSYLKLPPSGPKHQLVAAEPIGVEIIGYGSYTSYAYPAGLDLERIAPPPVVK